jgi:hypothetical protein
VREHVVRPIENWKTSSRGQICTSISRTSRGTPRTGFRLASLGTKLRTKQDQGVAGSRLRQNNRLSGPSRFTGRCCESLLNLCIARATNEFKAEEDLGERGGLGRGRVRILSDIARGSGGSIPIHKAVSHRSFIKS